MRDWQQRRVYAWEDQFENWNRSGYTLKECRKIVHWACKKYGLPPPSVRQHEGKAASYSYAGDRPVIGFNTTQKNAAVALHEAAHYICDRIFGPKLEHHSPEWMGIYLWLLEGWRVAPRTALHASAKAKRIKWVATWLVSPKRLRRGRV